MSAGPAAPFRSTSSLTRSPGTPASRTACTARVLASTTAEIRSTTAPATTPASGDSGEVSTATSPPRPAPTLWLNPAGNTMAEPISPASSARRACSSPGRSRRVTAPFSSSEASTSRRTEAGNSPRSRSTKPTVARSGGSSPPSARPNRVASVTGTITAMTIAVPSRSRVRSSSALTVSIARHMVSPVRRCR
ncbi:hypothetical protein ACFSTC_12215 [Nonomuraea ferruginea]